MAKRKEDERREILPDEEDDFFLDGPLGLDDDELLAESEYNVRAAGREHFPIAGGGNRQIGALEEEEISVEPEDLGRHVLEEATQQPIRSVIENELRQDRWPDSRWEAGEEEEGGQLDEPEDDLLVTDRDDPSVVDEERSDLTNQALRRRRRALGMAQRRPRTSR